jgi:hypothetical protein
VRLERLGQLEKNPMTSSGHETLSLCSSLMPETKFHTYTKSQAKYCFVCSHFHILRYEAKKQKVLD